MISLVAAPPSHRRSDNSTTHGSILFSISHLSRRWAPVHKSEKFIYHVLRHAFYINRSRLNEFLPRIHDDTGCARIVFRGWPSSWSESKQFENCLHFFNLLSANYNNFWSTYQYYEVWRQSNHEVWRTLSKLMHQFLNLDIVNSQSRRACIARCHPMTKSYEICTFHVGSHKNTNYIHLNQN